MRLDKWLWAARLFKTRALAQAAVEGGKVHCDGQRVKPGHAVRLGIRLSVRQGVDDRELIVCGLSEQRGPAAVAQQLYEETPASLSARLAAAELRKAAALSQPITDGRPDKRQRRQLHRFRDQHSNDQD
ncbi:hypothetical protein HPT27_01405 [Permianibacter sp. IMCC34836]|nr:hypothetical protein [Permianibacter fluminis]